jgi:hypothetical protein
MLATFVNINISLGAAWRVSPASRFAAGETDRSHGRAMASGAWGLAAARHAAGDRRAVPLVQGSWRGGRVRCVVPGGLMASLRRACRSAFARGPRFSVRRATKQAGNANARKYPQMNANGTGGAAPTLLARIGRARRLASAGCCPTHLPSFSCMFVAASWRYRGSQRRRRQGGPERVPRCMMLRRVGAAAVAAGARGAICVHCR